MKLGIVGSRRRNSPQDKAILRERILELKPDELVSGGCKQGADRFAEELAEEMFLPIKIFRPKLYNGIHGRSTIIKAYYARNERIAKYSNRLIALVTSDRKGGTENTIKYFTELYGEDELEIL